MKLVKCKSKKDCWKSGNVLPKVKRKVEGSFFQEVFFQKLFLDTHNANWRRLPKRLRPKCGSLLPKVQKKTKKWQAYSLFSKKVICPQTKIWTGNLMLWALLTKELRSKSDMFKVHKKWMKTNWEDFVTVLRQLWENWLNILSGMPKLPVENCEKTTKLFFFQTSFDSNILF